MNANLEKFRGLTRTSKTPFFMFKRVYWDIHGHSCFMGIDEIYKQIQYGKTKNSG